MTNTELLNAKIQESGLKRNFIAESLGISINSLANKVKGNTEFTASQIRELCEILNITSLSEREQIFFAETVD